MSWKKFSSNNSRKGVENNSKQKSSIYASKVFTNDIIVNNQADVGFIDNSNLNYTRDTYTSDSINILEFMHGTDISVNQIGVQNNVDTSGVVKIIKPIKAYVGLFNKLKGYDASFERLNVNTVNVKNINSIYDESKIEIQSNVSFNDVVDFNGIYMNHFNFNTNNTNNEVIISADISISTLDKSLKFKDASINSLESRLLADSIRFDEDISLNGSIFSIGVSSDELIVSDMSVNEIEAKYTSVNFTNDISVNGDINVDKIKLDFIVSHVSIQNDISINADLCCNHMKIDGNFGKFDNNTFLEFTDTVSFEKTLVKSDISATTITFNTGSNKVPTTEIIPDNPKNIITYGLNSYRDNSCIVIDGDVSINGKLDAEWDKTGMNIIPTLTSNLDLIKNIDDYKIGQFVILKIIGENEKIFIKSGENSWHNLILGNTTPFYTVIQLNSDNNNNNNHIFIDNTDDQTITIPDNSYTNLEGLEGTDIVFYVKKTYGLSREIFTLDISHNDPENDPITHLFDNSFSSYLDGAGWGISLEKVTGNSGTDISHVKILPPINNGFDFSFTVTIEEDRTGRITIPIEQKVIFKKINVIPEWTHIILGVSNDFIYSSDQSWNQTSQSAPNNEAITDKDASYTFDVHYFNPSIYANDTSYYILNLSALDPEKFDVSYRVNTTDDYVENHWSWNWVSQEAHKIQIKIPGVGYNVTDFSLEILAHDNSIPDVSNLIPESYYTGIDASKRIVKFQKINRQPDWNHMILSVSNSDLLLRDQSWNTTSNPSIQDSGDLSNQFYLYFDSCKNYVYSDGITDLSSYYLDLSALDFEGFDVSYDVSNVIWEDHNILEGGGGVDMLLAGAGARTGNWNALHQGEATASSWDTADVSATAAFNNSLTTQDYWQSNSSNNLPQWIEFKFFNDVIITKYKIWPRNTNAVNPKSWTLEGKPLGGTYNEIDSQSDVTDWDSTAENSITNDTNKKEFYVNNTTTAYRTFRLTITATNGVHSYVTIGELAFYGFIWEDDYILLAGAGGLDMTGNAQGTASESSHFLGESYSAKGAFNNTLSVGWPQTGMNALMHDSWHSDPDPPHTLPQWIEFEFPYDVIITKYKIWPRFGSPINPITWNLQGKPLGGTYNEIDSQSDVTDWDNTFWNSITNDTHKKEFYVNNTTTAYQKFKLNITVAGTNNNNTYNYVNIGELAFYGYIPGRWNPIDLSWAWVDKSRIVIDISDNARSSSHSALQIKSVDEWTTRPNPEKRIVKFKHISSQVITGFDISENGTTTTLNYNDFVNDYSYVFINNNITIEPSYQIIYSTYFGKYNDYSVNDITNDVSIQIVTNPNKKIDISTIILGDISFSFILNNIFKYNFNIYRAEFKFDDDDDSYINFYGNNNVFSKTIGSSNYMIKKMNNKEYFFKLTGDAKIECNINKNIKHITLWLFFKGGKGGDGGSGGGDGGGHGGGGGGGGSGYVIKINPDDKVSEEDQRVPEEIDQKLINFKVTKFASLDGMTNIKYEFANNQLYEYSRHYNENNDGSKGGDGGVGSQVHGTGGSAGWAAPLTSWPPGPPLDTPRWWYGNTGSSGGSSSGGGGSGGAGGPPPSAWHGDDGTPSEFGSISIGAGGQGGYGQFATNNTNPPSSPPGHAGGGEEVVIAKLEFY